MQSLRIVKNLMFSNLIYKTISLILGIIFWMVWGQSVPTRRTIMIPLTFYNCDISHIQAPELVRAIVSGTRSELRALNENQLTLPIDGNSLIKGENLIDVYHHQPLLPYSINVLYYEPSNLIVQVE